MKFKNPVCRTYDAASDSVKIWMMLLPTFILGCIWNVKFTIFEILWAFSVYLESISIIPQLVMLQRFAKENQGSVQNITAHYVFCLGMYRTLYVINWIYRYFTETSYWDPISWTTGTVQTCLFIDFFYYYIKAM